MKGIKLSFDDNLKITGNYCLGLLHNISMANRFETLNTAIEVEPRESMMVYGSKTDDIVDLRNWLTRRHPSLAPVFAKKNLWEEFPSNIVPGGIIELIRGEVGFSTPDGRIFTLIGVAPDGNSGSLSGSLQFGTLITGRVHVPIYARIEKTSVGKSPSHGRTVLLVDAGGNGVVSATFLGHPRRDDISEYLLTQERGQEVRLVSPTVRGSTQAVLGAGPPFTATIQGFLEGTERDLRGSNADKHQATAVFLWELAAQIDQIPEGKRVVLTPYLTLGVVTVQDEDTINIIRVYSSSLGTYEPKRLSAPGHVLDRCSHVLLLIQDPVLYTDALQWKQRDHVLPLALVRLMSSYVRGAIDPGAKAVFSVDNDILRRNYGLDLEALLMRYQSESFDEMSDIARERILQACPQVLT